MRKSVVVGVCVGVTGLAGGFAYSCVLYVSASLHRAAAKGDASTVRRLLNTTQRAQIDCPKGLFLGYPGNNLTPLMWAAREGHNDVVEVLVGSGAAIDRKDEFDRTALWFAAESGCLACAERLLVCGADPNARSRNDTPVLFVGIHRRDHEMIATLLKAGADPNGVGQIDQSALVEAVDTNDVEIVRLLLSFGADPARVQVGSMNILEYVRSSDGPSRAELEALLSASLNPD